MRHRLAAQLNNISFVLLAVIVFLTPLLVLPTFTEFYDTPKTIFLVIALAILIILKAISWITEGKVSFTRTPLDLPLLVFLVVIIASTWFSSLRHISLFGDFPNLHDSAINWIIYVLFYFLLTTTVKKTFQVRGLAAALILSGVVAALVSLSSYFNLFLPFGFAKSANFTPTGSAFSTDALLLLLIPVLLFAVMFAKRMGMAVAGIAVATLFVATISLTGYASIADNGTHPILGSLLVIITFITFVVTAYVCWIMSREVPARIRSSRAVLFGIPVLVGLVLIVVSNITIGSKDHPLHMLRTNYPQEVQLSAGDSWKVSASSFRDAPYLGTGPSTYPFDFTLYKPADYNLSKFWSLNLNAGYNEFFQTLATLGGLGILALLFLVVVVLRFGWRGVRTQLSNPLTHALAISAIVSVALILIHVSTLVSLLVTFTILGLLMMSQKSTNSQVSDSVIGIGIKISSLNDNNLSNKDLLPFIMLCFFVIVVGFVFWNGTDYVLADIHHRIALNVAPTNAGKAYSELVTSEQLNPMVDAYHSDLATTNFAIANAVVANKSQNQSSPSATLTDQDKQNIQTFLTQSINEGKAAVLLSPENAANWELLASIYGQISGVAQNALVFSLDAYNHAIQLDPLNPVLRLKVGGIYYSVKNYDMAIRFFTDAANLKPDYANAYFNLSIALRDKGDLTDATQVAQKTVSLLDPKSNDYKVANTYLSDLKSKLSNAQASASASTNAASQLAPAAPAQGALSQNQLPKVLALPSPSSIATPSAINK